jgi:UDP-N-acetylmuramoylalanine--D-glutamate ligase
MKTPVVLIAGGIDKGNDYTQIEELVMQKVKALVCLGKDNTKLISFFKDKVPMIRETEYIRDAVSLARQMADTGDVVLLSPACASFDLFKNYEDRGAQFKQAVQELMNG